MSEPSAGPDRANALLEMRTDPAAVAFPRFQIDIAKQRWFRDRPMVLWIYLVLVAAFAICLWAAGYPAWRVSILGGLVVAFGVLLAWLTHRSALRREALVLPCSVVLLLLGTIATGGLRSPLLVTPVFVLIVGATTGWTREAKVGLFLIAAVVLATPFLGPLVGPPIPEPYGALFTVLFILVSLAAVTDNVAALAREVVTSARDLFRARELVATEALSRTRELELLSSRLSHELKNPLGAIKALVQLSARSESFAEVRERLAVVEGEIARMDEILRGYLSFAKPLEPVRVEDTRLDEVVDDVFEVLEARARDAEVSLVRNGTAHAAVGRRRLQEALLNLVANSLEASTVGGTIRVELAEREGVAEIAVRDDGAGMPPHVLDRLGTAFFTTREDGNGLGVLLARRAFEQHGGTLEYESEPGKGTTATGKLPLRGKGCLDAARALGR